MTTTSSSTATSSSAPPRGRAPSGAASFRDAYDERTPPWDIGRPQRDLVAAFDRVGPLPSALDLGCGTGEHVLELARRGTDAWGLDSTPRALEIARSKADERGLKATFVQGDATDLSSLGRPFDAVVDCGLFHVISEADRQAYLRELRALVPAGGHHVMLGFAANTSGFGPRGYSVAELRTYLAEGWEEVLLREAVYEVNPDATSPSGHRPMLDGGMPAWLSIFWKVGP